MMAKTKQHRDELLENLRSGMSIVAACALSGVSRSTYYNWVKSDQEWAEEAEAAIRFGEAVQVARISQAGSDDWRAAAWLLERRFPNEWGPKQEIGITQTNDGGAALVVAMIEQTDQRLRSLGEEDDDG